MHIRPNQTNPSVQLDAMYAAEKSAAKAEAAQTRKKLMDMASALSAEAGEAYVVQVEIARRITGAGEKAARPQPAR